MSSVKNRLARNTSYMYMRMIFLMLISLYTTRILLRELGVSDYGIYNVVGSIVVMFTSLRGIFASSTQRFLNFEMGRGDRDRLQKVFSMSIQINSLIAVLFILCVEIVGLWFLYNKINIDSSRLFAAHVVFQLSLLSSVIAILTTPYDAVIIANEKMGVYAGISVLEAILKLSIIFLLPLLPFDRLITYAVLLAFVQILIRIINASYCHRHFSESHYKKCWDKVLFKDMASFAGWNFLGNTGYSLSNEGINMLLNVYGGPVVNASRGITYQVRYALEQFLSNVNKATDPYAMKLYSKNEKEQYFSLMCIISKILFCVYLCLAIPLFFYTDEILKIWLEDVPQYASVFIKLILINGIIRSYLSPLDVLFYSANKVKPYQIRSLIISILLLLTVGVLLYIGKPYYSAFIAMIVCMLISWLTTLIQAKKYCDFPIIKYLRLVTLPTILTMLISLLVSFLLYSVLPLSIWFVIVSIIIMFLLSSAFSFCICFSKGERKAILSLIH